MSREVELGCKSWTSFASSCSSTAVQRTLSLWLCPSTAVETAIAQCTIATSRWAMARGHRLNTSIVLAAVHGLSGLFRTVSAVEPSLFRPLPTLSPSLISRLTSVDIKKNVPVRRLQFRYHFLTRFCARSLRYFSVISYSPFSVFVTTDILLCKQRGVELIGVQLYCRLWFTLLKRSCYSVPANTGMFTITTRHAWNNTTLFSEKSNGRETIPEHSPLFLWLLIVYKDKGIVVDRCI